MRIYITDLEAYNNGHLVGAWLEFPMSVDELNTRIKDVNFEGQKACNDNYLHEEVFITDYEADFEIGEYDNIYVLNEIAEALEGFNEDELLKFRLLVESGVSERDIVEKGLDNYDVDIYDFRDNNSFTDTFELLAIELINNGLYGEIPKNIENYLDYEKMARDLRMDYCEFESGVIGRVS